jgi:branched-chain amino acid transport system ATP-binding protein
MDEVMAGLNPSEVNEAVEVVLKIRDAGVACLIVEHVLEGIMPIADKIVVLDRGSKIAEGTPQEVSRNEAVIHAYLGDE